MPDDIGKRRKGIKKRTHDFSVRFLLNFLIELILTRLILIDKIKSFFNYNRHMFNITVLSIKSDRMFEITIYRLEKGRNHN